MTLGIINGDNIYYPSIKGGLSWKTERKGVAGMLKFDAVQDNDLVCENGNTVFMIDDAGIETFQGYIFKKSPGKDGILSITAYDQLRYLKNKDSMIYENWTESTLLKTICSRFNMKVGTIEDTVYKVSRSEDNSALFDMIINAEDETMTSLKTMHVLYDDYGKVCLRNIDNMRVPILITSDTGQDYTYIESIDDETYNQIKLAYDNKETGERELYVAKDSNNIGKWGTLQYYEKLQSTDSAKEKANSLLKLYNAESKSLTVKDCFGDSRVRAGTMVMVDLSIDGDEIYMWMLVETASHLYNSGLHTMDLKLRGGDILA